MLEGTWRKKEEGNERNTRSDKAKAKGRRGTAQVQPGSAISMARKKGIRRGVRVRDAIRSRKGPKCSGKSIDGAPVTQSATWRSTKSN